jgi:hypothetical protein
LTHIAYTPPLPPPAEHYSLLARNWQRARLNMHYKTALVLQLIERDDDDHWAKLYYRQLHQELTRVLLTGVNSGGARRFITVHTDGDIQRHLYVYSQVLIDEHVERHMRATLDRMTLEPGAVGSYKHF